MNLYEKLMNIQSELKAPKNQYSDFGKYHYRSCEDILEGLKPLLEKYKVTLVISDDIKQVGDRYYIKATAELLDTEGDPTQIIIATAYAREDENKAKMDLSQMTGSASSYARKYALNGMFAIDDTKDSDATNDGDKGTKQSTSKPTPPNENKVVGNNITKPLSEAQIKRLYAIGKTAGYDTDTVNRQIKVRLNKKVDELTKAEYDTICKGYEGMKK